MLLDFGLPDKIEMFMETWRKLKKMDIDFWEWRQNPRSYVKTCLRLIEMSLVFKTSATVKEPNIIFESYFYNKTWSIWPIKSFVHLTFCKLKFFYIVLSSFFVENVNISSALYFICAILHCSKCWGTYKSEWNLYLGFKP